MTERALTAGAGDSSCSSRRFELLETFHDRPGQRESEVVGTKFRNRWRRTFYERRGFGRGGVQERRGFRGALCPVTAVAAEAGGDAAEAAITLAGTVGADVPVEAGAG